MFKILSKKRYNELISKEIKLYYAEVTMKNDASLIDTLSKMHNHWEKRYLLLEASLKEVNNEA